MTKPVGVKLDDELQEMHSQISLTLKQKIEEIHPQTIFNLHESSLNEIQR